MRSFLVRLLLPTLAVTAPLAAQISSPGGPVPVELLQKRRAAFLATMPKGRRSALLKATPLERHAPGTIADRAALERELDALRSRDLGIDNEEYMAGLIEVAVPVRDRRGRVAAAIAVHAPAARMSLEAALGHEAALRGAAASVARTLD